MNSSPPLPDEAMPDHQWITGRLVGGPLDGQVKRARPGGTIEYYGLEPGPVYHLYVPAGMATEDGHELYLYDGLHPILKRFGGKSGEDF